ncbi:MAG: hypothetical protein KAR01_11830 [Desulfocapsa sp.]|nr:hypothetical protein [Desulfocapsa sp.]
MNEFEVFSGTKDIILVAPHAYSGDDDTGTIVQLIQQNLDCSAVINETYRKPKRKEKPRCSEIHKVCNLNNIDEYEKKIPGVYNAFVGSIVRLKQEIIDRDGKPYIFFIHSGTSSLFNNACKRIPEIDTKGVDVLIGSGKRTEAGDNQESLTATEEEVQGLIDAFKSEKFTSFSTNSLHFSAEKPFDLNQLFRQERYCPDKRVTSFHLELSKNLLKDDYESLVDTANCLAKVLDIFTGGEQPLDLEYTSDNKIVSSETEKEELELTIKAEDTFAVPEERADTGLVKEAHARLAGIFFAHYKNALLEAGQYIIDKFYDGSIELARQKKPTKELSYTQLVKYLQEQQEDSPKKSWLFNAVNLVIQEHDFSAVQALGQLNTSQKLLLLPVSDPVQKQDLAEEAVLKNYTTRQLAEAIKKTKVPRNRTLYSCLGRPGELFSKEYSHLYSTDALASLKPKKLKTLREKIKAQTEEVLQGIREQEQYLKRYRALINTIDIVGKNDV